MGMSWCISSALLARLQEEAEAAYPVEICGLLVGRDGRIEAAVASPNQAADPRGAFEIDPRLHLAVQRQARAEGGRVLGHYHSHPSGDAAPSREDAARAEVEGALWLILGGGKEALWVARQGGAVHGRFDAVPYRLA
jgi:proteasome lid subunit RPN8/RPN11